MMYRNLEEILVNGAAGSDFTGQLTKVTELYLEVDSGLLKLQPPNLPIYTLQGGKYHPYIG